MFAPLTHLMRCTIRLLPVLFVLLLALPAFANTVTYDLEPMGMTYGIPAGQVPGDWIFSEDSADLYVTDFYVAGSPYFNQARIEAPYLGFGSVQILGINNIGLIYDFNAAGDASFEFLDTGGTVNIQVNGFGAVIEAPDFPSLGTFSPAPGVIMSTTWVAIPGGIIGTVTLTGPVQKLRVGGQELWVDDMDCNNGLGGGGSGGCDFEVVYDPLPAGTSYGAPFGNVPGDLAFVEDGIPVFMEYFQTPFAPFFNFMEVIPASATFGSVRVMHHNNINERFDIAALGVTVSEVSFEYYDTGGMENLRVNGAAMFMGDLHTAPAAIAPGVTFTVTTTTFGSDIYGQVVLTGDVQELEVGGQEFYIDNLCVKKAAPCDKLVHHESRTVGEIWGLPVATPPGTVMFTEDGIPVSIHEYMAATGGMFYNYCEISPNVLGFSFANTMGINNVTNHYDIAASGIVSTSVSFDYLDLGGEENLQVNGALYYVGELHLAPTAIAPGVTFSVTTTPVGGGLRGHVVLTGQVDYLVVGGQEFWIDTICVMGSGSSGPVRWCDHLSDIESSAMGSAWGGPYGDASGDWIFTEDGMDAHVYDYTDPTGMTFFGEARVGAAFVPFGTSHILTINNIGIGYDLAGLGATTKVRIDYFDGSGLENLQVNGGPLYIGELNLAPANIAPGVICTVYDTPAAGFSYGTVVLEGNVQTFLIGGQQFAIDNVCVRLAGSTTDTSPLPAALTKLLPNYPNPFNPSTTLMFSLGRGSHVTLTVHDMAGRVVRTLVDGARDAGEHSVLWDGKNERGGAVATGVYFVKVTSRDGVDTQKIALIK